MFQVKQGEVLFIGYYLFDSPKTVKDTLLVSQFVIYDYPNTKLYFDGRDDEAVAAALAQNYPNLDGPIVFRSRPRLRCSCPDAGRNHNMNADSADSPNAIR